MVADILDKKIPAKLGRKTVNMKRRKALAHRLVDQALAGDHRAIALLLKLDPGPSVTQADAKGADQDLAAEEEAMLLAFLQRVSGEGDQ